MKPLKPFAYFEPRDLPGASNLLIEQGEGSYLLAGGTDLLVRMKRGEISPSTLINLKRIQGLNGIERKSGEALSIGALTPISALAQSSLIQSESPVLAQAAGLLGWSVVNVKVRAHRARKRLRAILERLIVEKRGTS